MAGIGLQLNKVIARGTYLQSLTAFLSSVIITAGPWLSALVALTLLGSAAATFLNQTDRSVLFATITYAFSASLILTGGPQMVLTRYLADRLYVEDRASIGPICNGVLLGALPALVIALPYIVFAPFDLRLKLLGASLYLTMTLTWMLVIFLSATRSYLRIFAIFAIANVLSIGAAIGAGQWLGLIGTLGGFTLGQALCVALLLSRVYREFGPIQGVSFAFLPYFWRYKSLLAIGALYAIGIWADNILLWFAPGATVIGGYFHLAPSYDAAKLIAYLGTIPGGAIFLVQLEVHFYRHYAAYYRHIRERGSLRNILEAKAGMLAAVQQGFAIILGIQFVVGLLLFALAPKLALSFGGGEGFIRQLRILTLGVGCQFLALQVTILLLYLDQRRPTLFVVGLFTLTNILVNGTLLVTMHGTYGLGYLAAAFIALILALWLLFDRLRRLEFLTFTTQPMHV